jgi:multiple sugar transport system ATP-binding protein
VGKGFRIPVTTATAPAKVGLRPQHLKVLSGELPEGYGLISGTLDVIEPMGWEAYLHIQLSEAQTIIAHVEAETLRGVALGEPIKLSVAPNRLHLFDTQGKRLSA